MLLVVHSARLALLAFVVTLTVSASLQAPGADDLQAWEEFKREYNKQYERSEEETRRFEIWLDNRRFIESQNRAQTSFKTGLNPLSDLTTEEINETRTGFRVAAAEVSNSTGDYLFETLLKTLEVTNFTDDSDAQRAWYESLLTQPQLDWREEGRVSRVKDQGSCGSCWAFATTGALEGILAGRGQPQLLSEQNLVDCSARYGNQGCQGGLMDRALRYVRDYGIMSARSYPYTGREGQCRARRDRAVMRVRGSMLLPRSNESLLRVALALAGPIPVAIDASARSFHSYKSGVYDDRRCRSSADNLNHAVLLVGYGTQPNGGDYWILKNSWGRSWGDLGYIKVARNRRNLCGVASYAILPVP